MSLVLNSAKKKKKKKRSQVNKYKVGAMKEERSLVQHRALRANGNAESS